MVELAFGFPQCLILRYACLCVLSLVLGYAYLCFFLVSELFVCPMYHMSWVGA